MNRYYLRKDVLHKVVFFMTHNYLILKGLPDKIPHALMDEAVSFITTFHWTLSSETFKNTYCVYQCMPSIWFILDYHNGFLKKKKKDKNE